jgi:endoglucanase
MEEPAADAAPIPTGPGYTVQGNKIYAGNGALHRFRGVSRPSLEWSSSGEKLEQADYAKIASWGANVVRLPLSQSFWLADSAHYDAGYRTRIDQNVGWATAAGLDVILDLHRSDRGSASTAPSQQRMADRRSLEFWKQVATKFRNHPRVLFELYNEPHDVGWDVWLRGGPSGDGFTVAGMQQLYDAIRSTGANNLIIVGGLDFAYDLRGLPEYAIDGHNVLYATHPYRPYPTKAPSEWPTYWGFLADTNAIIITEFGDISGSCAADFNAAVIDYAEAHAVSWIGWAWYPAACSFPSLIADWSGTPTLAGRAVRDALMEVRQ